MNTSRPLALGALTVLGMTPPDIVSLAAECGYDYAGLRLLPATPGGIAHPLMHDRKMLDETLARIRDTGVGIFDLEIVRIDAQFDSKAMQPFLETGAELGAQCILVAGDDPDLGRFSDNFAAFCDAAAPFGLKPNLEFMPWTRVPDLGTALEILAAIDRDNAGLLIDAIHFGRSSSRLGDLGRIPARWLQYAQICDAPAQTPPTTEEIIRAAREERLLPGDGGLPLAELFRRLPRALPLCVEVPNPALGSDVERARRALAATRTWLAEHLEPATVTEA